MSKSQTRLQKSTNIITNSLVTEWKYVNVDNEFEFMNKTFVINDSVDEYKVYNKAGMVENFTNESYMEEILISLDKNNNLRFYNQNYDEIDSASIRIKQ